MVFQDPHESLDPRYSAREAIAEPLRRLKGMTDIRIWNRVLGAEDVKAVYGGEVRQGLDDALICQWQTHPTDTTIASARSRRASSSAWKVTPSSASTSLPRSGRVSWIPTISTPSVPSGAAARAASLRYSRAPTHAPSSSPTKRLAPHSRNNFV